MAKASSKKSAAGKGGLGKGASGKVGQGASAKSNNHKPAKPAAPTRTLVIAKRPGSSAVKVAPKQTLVIPAKPGKSLPVVASKPAPVAKVAKKEKEADRRGIVIPAPVPTDMKPAKNRLGMKSAELEHFRDLLLAKRRELVGDMSSMEREALNRGGNSNLSNLPMHMADMGTDNYEQEFTLGLMEKDRNLLREINSALAKIQDGSYGICEGTGLPITKPRLEAQPWAKYSIEYARKLEQRGVR